MTRQLRELTAATLDLLPEACRRCAFWEAGDAPRGPSAGGRSRKAEWVGEIEHDWGAPGVVIVVDGEGAAYGLLAPGARVKRRLSHEPSEDALLLTTLWVAPAYRQSGMARVLLQALLRSAHEHGSRAVEAYGARGGDTLGTCVLPAGFLRANGFVVLHDHPRYPLLRLDLRQTARWQESLSHALEAVLQALPSRRPQPARSPSS
jgi:GNAT superfamily N-acetyltransferase